MVSPRHPVLDAAVDEVATTSHRLPRRRGDVSDAVQQLDQRRQREVVGGARRRGDRGAGAPAGEMQARSGAGMQYHTISNAGLLF